MFKLNIDAEIEFESQEIAEKWMRALNDSWSEIVEERNSRVKCELFAVSGA